MKIKQLRQDKGVTQQQLADAIGISRVAVSKWESGETKDLKRENLLGIAKFFNLSLAEVLDVNEQPNISPGIRISETQRGIPIISWVQAGHWREVVDAFPMGRSDEVVMAQNTHGPHAFAVRIVGNSMEPEFREHDVVVIDPDVMPKPGDYVVARNHEEAATFKKYRPRGIVDGHEVFELVPLNEDYAVMRSDQQPIQIIGTMMEHTRFRRG